MAEIKSIKLPNGTTYDLAMKQMVAATSAAAGSAGAVPAPAAGENFKYLRGDGTWDYPPGGEIGLLVGATSQDHGEEGLVPAPAAGDQVKFLRGDGHWADLEDSAVALDEKTYGDIWDFTGDNNNTRGEFYFLHLTPWVPFSTVDQGNQDLAWEVSYFITIKLQNNLPANSDARVKVKGVGNHITDYQVTNISYKNEYGYNYSYDKSQVFSYHVVANGPNDNQLYFGISFSTMLTASGDGYQAGDNHYPNQAAYLRTFYVKLLNCKNCVGAVLLDSLKIDDGNDSGFSARVNATYNNFCDNKTGTFHKGANVMKGATFLVHGQSGYVPAPVIGDQVKFLRGDGTWVTPTNTTYEAFSSSNEGLVPIAKSGTTNYATSAYVLTGAGWQAGTKYNTDTDTTYAAFSSSNSGLVPAAKNGTTNYATSAYVLTGAGWKSGTKYNTDTTYANVVAATSNAMGVHGLVPTPNSAWFSSGAQDPSLIYLSGTGTWKWTNTFISNVLTDTSTYKALSAAQGKVLNDKINNIGSNVTMAWTSYTATTTWTKQTSKSLALTAGTWLINIYARSGQTNNSFQLTVGTTAYNAGNASGMNIVTVPRKTDNTDAQGSSLILVTLSAATTYYPYIVCGNGTGTQIYVKAEAYRLK